MQCTVIFQGAEISVDSIEAFGQRLDEFDTTAQFELWLHAAEGPRVCMLRNERDAWLLYLRHEGDSGYTTSGDPRRTDFVSYHLSNQQVDEYPGEWCIPVEDCYKGLAFFFVNNGAQPEWISWKKS